MRKLTSLLTVLIMCICFGGYAAADTVSEETAAEETAAEEIAAADTASEETAAEDDAATDTASEKSEGTKEALAEKGLLRVGLTDSVKTMDVHKTTEDYMIPLNIYERLFDIQVNEDGSTQLAYGLADDYSVSDDGRRYEFSLREDAYFSDGTPVTAADVEYTITRMLSLKESVQTDFADMIIGARAVMEGYTDRLRGIHVVDDHHLQIVLSEPFAGYIYQLATPSCSILSKEFTTKAGDAYGSSAELTIGSGPYKVTEFTEKKIALERNPYYNCHEGESLSVEKADVLMLPPAIMDTTFQEGGLDILDTNYVNPEVVENVYKSDRWKDRLVFRSRVETQYLMLNVETAPLTDIRVRKAIQMAIDRQEILDILYGGDGILVDGIYPRGLIGYNEENQGWLKYDPEEAKRLISEVPYAGEIRVELAANSQSSTRRLSILEMIRQDLSEAGLNASIVSYDEDSRLYLRQSGRLMAYSGEWSADFNDPDNFIYTFFGSRGKTLYRSSNYADEDTFARIMNARTIQDEEMRMEEYSDLEMLLVRDEAVWVPLFSTDHIFVLGERVESFTPFWAGWSSMYFKDVVLKQ